MTILSELAIAVDRGLTILTHRVLTILALVMAFGLFSWAMLCGTVLSLVTAGIFGVSIFLPILFTERKPGVPNGDEA